MRLIKRGLMYGNLVPVTSKALVGRYNRALMHLTGKETALNEFHVDISGYSPEIGHEFDDDLYLNPRGCNQQFILLSTEQKSAPLLMSNFSTSRSILKDFISDNEDQLFALTAKEAVAGELINSVFDIANPADLLKINQITIEADTAGELIADAQALTGHIQTFMTEDDAWWDDVLISQMVELAKQTGNIQRHPLNLTTKPYAQGNYYTSHFGGIYIFKDIDKPTVIARQNLEGLEEMSGFQTLTFGNTREIARFLQIHDLVELIATRKSDTDSAIIRQKLDFIVISVAASSGDELGQLSRQDIRKLERNYAPQMPTAYHGLMDIWRWASLGGAYPELEPEHDGYFYAFRARQGSDRDLVNMLLADLSPLDFRQLYICHKDAFYAAYRGWGDAKKEYVSRFLAEEYAIDKAGAREALFGPEPTMEDAKDGKPVGKAGDDIRWKYVQTRDGTYRVPRYESGGLREELNWKKKPKRKTSSRKSSSKKTGKGKSPWENSR